MSLVIFMGKDTINQFNDKKKEIFVLKEQFTRIFFNKENRLLDLIKRNTRLEIYEILEIFNDTFIEDWETDNYQDFNQNINTDNVDYLTNSFKFILNAIFTSPAYLKAKEAYDNQQYGNLSEEEKYYLYYFLEHYYNNSDRQFSNFYHGIQLFKNEDNSRLGKKLIMKDTTQYIDTIKNIYNYGIKAHTAYENFPGLESIFCAKSPEYSYGIAGVKFSTDENDIYWQHSNGFTEGIQFVKPLINKNFIVYIKTLKYLIDTTKNQDSTSSFILKQLDIDKYQNYTNTLMQLLDQNNIPFVTL